MQEVRERIEKLYDATVVSNILSWLQDGCSSEDREQFLQLLDHDPESLKELFSKSLEFGTAGLRSLIGIGTNRINIFSVRKATQSLSSVLRKKYGETSQLSVVVGYDTRNFSLTFAQEAAKVLAANQIHALLFQRPEPLAMVSFLVRQEKAAAGIMITASHNPPAYNGYKVYMASGGQVLPPMDREIMMEFALVEKIRVVESLENPYIHILGKDQEDRYVEAVRELQLYPQDNQFSGAMLQVGYSPLHGTGRFLVPAILQDWGFSSISCVAKQMVPDGDFSTVRTPNPEEVEALTLGIEQLISQKQDIFIATDPDSDRLGVVCLADGEPYVLNGNQIACLLADHILRALSQKHLLDFKDKLVKSLVTTEMLVAIADHYGADLVNVATGFKYIGQKIEEWKTGPNRYCFGAEESYGYLYGSLVEDKDAVSTSALLVEMALQYKLRGKTLRDAILDLYETHGYFLNKTESIAFSSDMKEQVQKFLTHLENADLRNFVLGPRKLERFENYAEGVGICLRSGNSYALTLPKTSMFCYYFERGKVVVRPSGTEPKIKLYFEIVNPYSDKAPDLDAKKQRERESTVVLEEFMHAFRQIFIFPFFPH